MLKSYKNEIFYLIKSSGLDPKAFKSFEDDDLFKIEYSGTPMWFTLRQKHDHYHQFQYAFLGFTPSDKAVSSSDISKPDTYAVSYTHLTLPTN